LASSPWLVLTARGRLGSKKWSSFVSEGIEIGIQGVFESLERVVEIISFLKKGSGLKEGGIIYLSQS
jgi:hypothetical protein